MTDIVERLLKLAERERPYGSLPDALEEAAAEIERLKDGEARLRLALEATSSDCKEAFADNESLRLALEVAANDLDDWGAYTKANNARAALEGE